MCSFWLGQGKSRPPHQNVPTNIMPENQSAYCCSSKQHFHTRFRTRRLACRSSSPQQCYHPPSTLSISLRSQISHLWSTIPPFLPGRPRGRPTSRQRSLWYLHPNPRLAFRCRLWTISLRSRSLKAIFTRCSKSRRCTRHSMYPSMWSHVRTIRK